jgi:hypothetical protein
MQAERTALIQSVLDAIQALGKNEAIFLPTEVVVARSNTGKLRIGSKYGPWYRCADVPARVEEHLTDALNPHIMGHFARQYRRDLPYYLRPVPGTVARGAFIVDRKAMGLPA